MNILWIPNFCPFPPNNGGKLLTYNRLLQVSKKHDIYLIVEDDGEMNEGIYHSASSFCKEFIVVPKEDKSTLRKVVGILRTSRNVEKYKNENITRKALEIMSCVRIDLINIDLPMPIINLLNVVNQIKSVPIIINQQNIECENVRSKVRAEGVSIPMRIYASIESALLKRWERSLYLSDTIAAQSFVSPEDLSLFKRIFKYNNRQELMCSPIGVDDTETFPHEFKHQSIVFVASFDYPPNIHGAIWLIDKVFPKVLETVPDAKLYLVGRNPDESIVKRGGGNIIVTGTVESVKPYFEMADLFVVPVFIGGGVKTKLIEAGIYGKPIVSTSSGANGTAYVNGDEIIICNEADSFADYCANILTHPEQYRDMCEKLRDKTQKMYLWDSIGREYIEFLERQVNR